MPFKTTNTSDESAAWAWIDRWEAQQDQFMSDREERFDLLFDLLEAVTDGGPMTVLDLGCGPGSLSIRLLRRFPQARVVGVDLDPVLLQLGRSALAGEPRLRLVTADLADPDWVSALGLDEAPAAALSTTALHWLQADALTRLYGVLARLLRPGGVLLDGDHAQFPGQPRLQRAAEVLAGRIRARRTRPLTAGETWDGWWEAIRMDPAYAAAFAERERLHHSHHRDQAIDDGKHMRLLHQAGFREAGVVWQHGDDRILAALS